jgi:hypothetical protein
MTVRVIYRNPPRERAGGLRRPFIYPHRSVRFIAVTRGRLALAGVAAAALTIWILFRQGQLLEAHFWLCTALLTLAGVSATGVTTVSLYEGVLPAPVPVVASYPLEQHPWLLGGLFAAGFAALYLLRRKASLAGGFIVFLMTLLALSAGVVLWRPGDQMGAIEFSQVWLRVEFLVWLLLPWFAAGMFLLIHPLTLVGMGWTAATLGFGFLWSVVRLAFCIGVLHYTGFLFIPLLWFVLGLLADTVYLMVAFSALVHAMAETNWGPRKSWQF